MFDHIIILHRHVSTTTVNIIRVFYNNHAIDVHIVVQNVLVTTEMHSSYNQFNSTVFLSALYVSNESSLSSPGARHNILYYTVWYSRYNRAIRRV